MLGMPFSCAEVWHPSPCSPGNALRARTQLGEGSPSRSGCTSGAVGRVGEFLVPFLNAAGAHQWGTVTVRSCVKENNPSHTPGMPRAVRDLCPTRPTCTLPLHSPSPVTAKARGQSSPEGLPPAAPGKMWPHVGNGELLMPGEMGES